MVLALFALAVSVPSARADIITFTLDQDGCTGTCGSAPFGTVVISDNGSGNSAFVHVVETLAANENFAGSGAGQDLEFNVAGAITISHISPGSFIVGPAPATASTFGTFLASVTCDICQGGSGPTGPLSFDVGSATGVTTANFFANAGGYFFASDISGNNGKTGNVAPKAGRSPQPPPVPEPTSIVLFGTLVSAGFLMKKFAA